MRFNPFGGLDKSKELPSLSESPVDFVGRSWEAAMPLRPAESLDTAQMVTETVMRERVLLEAEIDEVRGA